MKKLSLFFTCFFIIYIVKSQTFDPFIEEWKKMHESKSEFNKVFNDLKFGMFIHWGVYSKLGGVWNGENIIPETHGGQALLGEWIMYGARIPRNEYLKVAKTFNPVGFNAEQWVKTAKEAGMRYIVAMTKHHDGFAMYHSKVSDYNIYDYTPFKRDPIEELYKACEKYGLRMGLYYSHSIDWLDGGDSGNAQYNEANPDLPKDSVAANIWDPPSATFQEYIEDKAKPQMREILTKFPNLLNIWYDFPRHMSGQQSFEFYKLAYDFQPQALINSRVGNDLGDYSAAGDNRLAPEDFGIYKLWETPGTLNNTWGYKSYDNDWKSIGELLINIAEIASKGANYLLNVGPDGNGVIPEASVRILKEIGEWMKVNGEAVYGTTRWTTMKEGPTEIGRGGTSHRKEHGFTTAVTSEDFWFTQKDNFVYVISLADPVNNISSIKSLYNYRQKIKNIKILGENRELKWRSGDNSVDVEIPSVFKSNLPGYVLKVQLSK